MADIPNVNPDSRARTVMDAPDKIARVRDLFDIDSDMEVPVFSEADERVPDLDPAYVFDPATTLAICAGFAKNRRVMVQGYHGTGKSTHIERSPPGSTGRPSGSTSTPISAASTWSAATPSCSARASRS